MSKTTLKKRIQVHFQVQKRVQYGQALYVIGNVPELGNWDINKALRLSWNQDHYWSGTGQISGIMNEYVQFKYVIGLWYNASTGRVEWQTGKNNRKIRLNQTVICEHNWNMENIVLNLLIHKNDLTLNDYFVSGNTIELGQWKQCKELRQQRNESQWQICTFKLQEEIKKQLQDYKIFTHNFKVYRTTKQLHYYYIKRSHKSHKTKVERIPGRKFDLQNSKSLHPHCLYVEERDGDLLIFQQCHFNQLIYSSINQDIFLGPYIKNTEDLQTLKEDGVGAILSIQSNFDYQNHSLSSHYISILCQEYEILFSSYSIIDANPKDFNEKWKGAVLKLIKLIKKCRSQNKKVYLHCTAGIYRSSQVLVLYFTIQSKYTLEEAIKFVKRKHLFAQPNKKLLSTILSQFESRQKKK